MHGAAKAAAPCSNYMLHKLIPYAECSTDIDWKPPYQFRNNKTSKSLVAFWLKTCADQCGCRPVYNIHAMLNEADQVLCKIGYDDAIRVLAYMATTMSKYYQYPYTVSKVIEAFAEFNEARNRKTEASKVYDGFIGPVGLVNLAERYSS